MAHDAGDAALGEAGRGVPTERREGDDGSAADTWSVPRPSRAPRPASGDRARSVAGGGSHLAEPAQEAISVEGAARPAVDETQRVTRVWLFQPEAEPREVSLSDLLALPAVESPGESAFVWIDLAGYAPEDLRAVAALLHLHRVAVHTALSAWKRPRLDIFGDAYFACVTVARLDRDALRVNAAQLDLFVGRSYLVSAHRRPAPFAERILTRALQNPQLVKDDPAYMLYIVLDELLHYYQTLDEQVQAQIELFEERALTDTSEALLEDLLRFKRYVFALDHLVEQHRPVFAAFLRPDFTFVSGEVVEVYFRDLEALLAQLLDDFQAAQNAVNGVFDIYVSHVSYRTNQIMKLLTMVSTVLLPATLIAAIFGTAFQGVPLYQPWDFALMLILILLVAAFALLAFRRRRWL